MRVPNFLGIGVQRAGTTLLHRILDAHDEVYVPSRRKEVHYFDWYYERGPEWYARFFPDEAAARRYRAIGEVTPDYIFHAAAPDRIRSLLPDCRFIISLRNPIYRLYSWYLFSVRSFNERRNLDVFIEQEVEALTRGRYSEQLRRYFSLFPRDAFFIAIYEELIDDPAAHLEALASFLGLSRGWPDPAGLTQEPVNASDIPRFRAAFARAQRFGEMFTRHDLDRMVRLARRVGIPRLFGTRASRPQLSEHARRKLQDFYREEVAALEELLGRDLEVWRSGQQPRVADSGCYGAAPEPAHSRSWRAGLPAAHG